VILFVLCAFSSTHFVSARFNDNKILGKSVDKIIQNYGKFNSIKSFEDKGEKIEQGFYYLETTGVGGEDWYYEITFDENSIAVKVDRTYLGLIVSDGNMPHLFQKNELHIDNYVDLGGAIILFIMYVVFMGILGVIYGIVVMYLTDKFLLPSLAFFIIYVLVFYFTELINFEPKDMTIAIIPALCALISGGICKLARRSKQKSEQETEEQEG
jgi:hypothetical protein